MNRLNRNRTLAVAACIAAAAFLSSQQSVVGADRLPESVDILRAQSDAFAWVAEKSTPAVVYIQVEKLVEQTRGPAPFNRGQRPSNPGRFFGPQGPNPHGPNPQAPRTPEEPFKQRGQGSGFLISDDGYILTNNHVVGDADRVVVHMNDGREFDAEVVGADPQSDIALIKVDGRDLPYLELADSDVTRVGEWVLAIGSPFGLTHSVTAGIVSATGRNSVGVVDFENFIQTDAAINPGNSGGPLVDLYGRAVGVNTLIYSRSGGNMGIGFAIPVNMAKWVKDQLIDGGEVTRGYLGVWIQTMDKDIAESFGLDANRRGALIGEIGDDSPAARSGLQQGDIVIEMDGKSIEEHATLRNYVAMTAPGETIDMTILRDGQRQSLDVEIGERPEDIDRVARRSVIPPILSDLGIGVQDLSDDIAAELGFEGEEGVVVTRVKPGSPAYEAGIRRGNLIQQVNRGDVGSVDEFHAALNEVEPGRPVSMLISNGRSSRFVALRIR